MSLTLRITPAGTTPIYRQLVEQVCRAVATGALAAGDQLPSVRALAEELVVNPNTVVRAYNELARDGIVEARPGRGFFVALRRPLYSQPERTRRLGAALDTFLSEAVVLHFTPDELRTALEQRLAEIPSASPPEGGLPHA